MALAQMQSIVEETLRAAGESVPNHSELQQRMAAITTKLQGTTPTVFGPAPTTSLSEAREHPYQDNKWGESAGDA